MNFIPEPLNTGDTIAIVAPAKRIEASHVHFAKGFLEKAGFRVQISKYCLEGHNYFSGTVDQRLQDLQQALSDTEIKAILCARGGYGCVQLVDRLDWSEFQKNPKWICGFSDVTVLHSHLQSKGIASIHGTMPLNFKENTPEALQTLLDALKSNSYRITGPAIEYNQTGNAKGVLMGGNLSIVASLIGTNDQPDYVNSILFVEEIGEPLYSIDRMFYSLKKAGILDKIRGLIIGGMTSLKDSETPYGASLEEIIASHTSELEIPVCFHFPAGHINDNRALILGSEVSLNVTESGATLTFS